MNDKSESMAPSQWRERFTRLLSQLAERVRRTEPEAVLRDSTADRQTHTETTWGATLVMDGLRINLLHDLMHSPERFVMFCRLEPSADTPRNLVLQGALKANLVLGVQHRRGWCMDAEGEIYLSEGIELEGTTADALAQALAERVDMFDQLGSELTPVFDTATWSGA